MQPQKRADELFAAALELSAEHQPEFLAAKCGEDSLLLAEINSLLKFAERAEELDFMNETALDLSAKQVVIEEASEDLSGQLFDRYKILSLIGEGGMGKVYLAQDTELKRQVAVKLIRGNLATKEILRRFHNEQQILANLQHANIAQLLDGGTAGGLPFFVMEYVDGLSLNDYANAKELSATERLKLFRRVCEAVQFAHQNLIIHRDIKPSNILVTSNGEPKLLDFGIAKLLVAPDAVTHETETVFQLMTPEYASPEQVTGGLVTTATDVYSLGAVLYELLTGQRPHRFSSRRPADIVDAICSREPEKPSAALSRMAKAEPGELSGEPHDGSQDSSSSSGTLAVFEGGIEKLRRRLRGDLDNIVLMAMRKQPARRYASVGQLSDDIARHLSGLPVLARKDTLSYRAAKFVRRNRVGVGVAAAMLVLLVSGIVATAWQARVARAQQAKSDRRFNQVRKLAHSVLFDYHDAIASLSGSTKVRERLVKDALEYLDSLAQEAGEDVSLQRELATAYIRVGDVQGRPYRSNLGQTDGALISYRKALAILEPVSVADPGSVEVQRELAIACERIGTIQLRKANTAEASEKTSRALVIREALSAADPSNANYRRELADSYIYSADVVTVNCSSIDARECGRKAIERQTQALEIRMALAKDNSSDPQLQRDLAQAHMRVGFGFTNMATLNDRDENLRRAVESHEKALTIRAELALANPDNAPDRRNLGDQYMLLSDAQVRNGDLNEALDGYRKALAIFEPLSVADPSNAEARLDLSFALTKLGAAEFSVGNGKVAHRHYEEALPVLDRLVADDPTDVEAIAALVMVYDAFSDESAKAGDISGAIEQYGKVIGLSERLRAGDRFRSQRALAGYYRKLAALCVIAARRAPATGRLERWQTARAWLQKSFVIYQGFISMKADDDSTKKSFGEVAEEIAVCDAAIGNLNGKQ